MRRPDEHDVPDPTRDQLHAAENEGPHEDLAQLGIGLHQRQQAGPGRPRSPRPARPARRRTKPRRPESMLSSPVNWPGRRTATTVSTPSPCWTISTRPAITTKNGALCTPASTSTSPAARAALGHAPRSARSAPRSASERPCRVSGWVQLGLSASLRSWAIPLIDVIAGEWDGRCGDRKDPVGIAM